MSTAMMSAPSCAIRMACALPCPRAAPVMKATLPSKRPAMCPPCCRETCCRETCCREFLRVRRSKAAAVDRVHLLVARAGHDEDVHIAHRLDVVPAVVSEGLADESGLGPEAHCRSTVLRVPRPVRGPVAAGVRSTLNHGGDADFVVADLLRQDERERLQSSLGGHV